MKQLFQYCWLENTSWVEEPDIPQGFKEYGVTYFCGKWKLYVTEQSRGKRVRFGYYESYNFDLKYDFGSNSRTVHRGWVSSKEEFDQLMEDFEIFNND